MFNIKWDCCYLRLRGMVFMQSTVDHTMKHSARALPQTTSLKSVWALTEVAGCYKGGGHRQHHHHHHHYNQPHGGHLPTGWRTAGHHQMPGWLKHSWRVGRTSAFATTHNTHTQAHHKTGRRHWNWFHILHNGLYFYGWEVYKPPFCVDHLTNCCCLLFTQFIEMQLPTWLIDLIYICIHARTGHVSYLRTNDNL